jgi:hypothetical protein
MRGGVSPHPVDHVIGQGLRSGFWPAIDLIRSLGPHIPALRSVATSLELMDLKSKSARMQHQTSILNGGLLYHTTENMQSMASSAVKVTI